MSSCEGVLYSVWWDPGTPRRFPPTVEPIRLLPPPVLADITVRAAELLRYCEKRFFFLQELFGKLNNVVCLPAGAGRSCSWRSPGRGSPRSSWACRQRRQIWKNIEIRLGQTSHFLKGTPRICTWSSSSLPPPAPAQRRVPPARTREGPRRKSLTMTPSKRMNANESRGQMRF